MISEEIWRNILQSLKNKSKRQEKSISNSVSDIVLDVGHLAANYSNSLPPWNSSSIGKRKTEANPNI